MKNRVTIVIPYKKLEDSEELKYVLRSIDRHAKFRFQLCIVGDLPDWVNPNKILHLNPVISQRDVNPKAFNVIDKLKYVAHHDEVDERILLMYDDIVFLRDIRLDDIKELIALQELPSSEDFKTDASTVWKMIIINTMRALQRNNLPYNNYETHLPRLFEKERMQNVFKLFGFTKRAYCFPTIYYNYYYSVPDRFLNSNPGDIKAGIYFQKDLDNLQTLIGNNKWLNWGEKFWVQELKEILRETFPEKGKYEL